jgi:hypothetical protein
VFTFPGMFSPATKKLGDWVPAVYGFIIALSFISYIGVWHMKRWGVEMYIAVVCVKQIFFLFTDQMGIGAIVGSCFFALVHHYIFILLSTHEFESYTLMLYS